jgi:hypothetical protein
MTKYEGARTAKSIEQHALSLLHDKLVTKVCLLLFEAFRRWSSASAA